MCYSGKCIYEDYMGDCNAPAKEKNPCWKGHKYYRKEQRNFKIKSFIFKIKYKFSKKYREKIDSLPF